MGLDVVAYEKLEWVRELTDDDPPDDLVPLAPNDDFPARADGLRAGWYRASGARHEFRAGSYSGYSAFRHALAELIGTTVEAIWASPQPGPFMELVDFADNEGVLGPSTSAKLAADFREWSTRLQAFAQPRQDRDGLLGVYADFQRAFELAAAGGAVTFG